MSKNRQKGKRGVLICGAYGMRNAGDEAVLEAVLAELRSIDPEMPVTVLSRDPSDTHAAHGVPAIHSFNLFGLLGAMRRSLLFLNGGGSLIQDVTSSRSLWYYLFTLWAGRLLGCRVMMYGCGVGPVNRPFNRRLAGRVIDRNVDAVTLREARSADTLRELGVKRPAVTVAAEPALSLRGAPAAEIDAIFERNGMRRGAPYFCMCVRRWPGMRQKSELFAAAADYAWEKYGLTPVLFAVNLEQDVEIARQIREGLSETTPCVLITESLTTPQVIGFFARMRAVLAMRLHALIFSASQAVPLIGISYDPKVASFLESAVQKNYLQFEELTRPEQLYDRIDEAMVSDREALRRATAALRDRERRNLETARRLYQDALNHSPKEDAV